MFDTNVGMISLSLIKRNSKFTCRLRTFYTEMTNEGRVLFEYLSPRNTVSDAGSAAISEIRTIVIFVFLVTGN